MSKLALKPNHKPVQSYYATSRHFGALDSQRFSRAESLNELDRLNLAIEHAASLNVAKAHFRRESKRAATFQNELHVVVADGVSSIQTKIIQ